MCMYLWYLDNLPKSLFVGSGRSAIAASNGIYIDPTPPVISTMFHVDMSWNSDEPSTHQGSNDTIAVYFNAQDKESEVWI